MGDRMLMSVHSNKQQGCNSTPHLHWERKGLPGYLGFRMYNGDVARSQGKDFIEHSVFTSGDSHSKGGVKTAGLMDNAFSFTNGIPTQQSSPISHIIEASGILTKSPPQYKDSKGHEKYSILINKKNISDVTNLCFGVSKIGLINSINDFLTTNVDFIKGDKRAIMPNNYLDYSSNFVKFDIKTNSETGLFSSSSDNPQLSDNPTYTNFAIQDENNAPVFITGPDSNVTTFDQILEAYGNNKTGIFRISFRLPYMYTGMGENAYKIGVKAVATCITRIGSTHSQYSSSPFLVSY